MFNTCLCRKKYGELNSDSAITKLELNMLIVPITSRMIMIPITASVSFAQKLRITPPPSSSGAFFVGRLLTTFSMLTHHTPSIFYAAFILQFSRLICNTFSASTMKI